MATPGVQSTISDTRLYARGNNNITNTVTNTSNRYGDLDPISRLLQHCALGALHDAAERPDPPKCHKDTRIAILNRVNMWARDKSINAKQILWISGAAGAGKSAICQTQIERWQEPEDESGDSLVVLEFFLWRTAAQRNQKTHVVPTLAFQLTQLLPETQPIIKKAVQNGTIFSKNLTSQVKALIVNPLRMIQTSSTTHTIVIVLDGLDECCVDLPKKEGFPGQHYESQQREILDAIAFACQQVPSLRILVASRPERETRESFAGKPLSTLSLLLSLSHEYNAAADIALYLDCTFAEIRSKHPGLNSSWPSREQMDELIEKSSGQFIYPSTVVKYVSQPRQYPPTRLDEVLALQPSSGTQRHHPLAELDALYTLVLKTVSKVSLPIVRILLGHMVYRRRYGSCGIFQGIRAGNNTAYLEKFFFLQDGELATHLTDLHSILSISTDSQNGLTEIGFFHATLSEYLRNKSRHPTIQQLSNPSVYDLPMLYSCLAFYVSCSSPSIALMKGLWSLLMDEFGEYCLCMGACQSTQVEDQPKYFKGKISYYLGSRGQCELLNYLQKCNIPEIEPSKASRKAIVASLQCLWKFIHLDGKCQYHLDCSFPKDLDTGDMDASEEEHGKMSTSPHPAGLCTNNINNLDCAKKRSNQQPFYKEVNSSSMEVPTGGAQVHAMQTRKRKTPSEDTSPSASLVVSSQLLVASLPDQRIKRTRKELF